MDSGSECSRPSAGFITLLHLSNNNKLQSTLFLFIKIVNSTPGSQDPLLNRNTCIEYAVA